MSFETYLARRYLKIKHQRKLVPLITVLATFGVAVGVMVLVVVIAVMTGFQAELKDRILGIEAHMVVMRFNDWIADYQHVANEIEQVSGVKSASPFVYSQGLVRSAEGVSGIILRGIEPKRAAIRVHTPGAKDMAQLFAMTDPNSLETGVVLGTVLADKLKVGLGDGVMVMLASANKANPRQLMPMKRLKVVGVFESGMHKYDGAMGFVEIGQLQRLMGIADLAKGINVRVDDVDRVEVISQTILSRLGLNHWTTHWKQLHRNLFSMLAMQKIMMYVILTLIIVVAAFNVASALIMMVKEKTKDISILKAMGANNRSSERIFLGKGIVIGVAGIIIGVMAGWLLCLAIAQYPIIELPGDVYFLTTLPVQINVLDLGLIVLGTLVICIFASLYPAKKAAKMNPVDGIRYG